MARGDLTYIAEMPRAEEGENPPSLIFDAVVNLSPSSSARLTKYPISDKSEIANHRVKGNPTLQLICWMGRAPLQNYSNNLVGSENENLRPSQALKVLEGWDEKDTELYIASEYKNFSGYVITKLDWSTEKTDAIKFVINLEKARRVTYAKGILIKDMDPVKSLDAKGNSSGGSVDSKKVENEYILDDVGGFYFDYLKDGTLAVDLNGGNNSGN